MYLLLLGTDVLIIAKLYKMRVLGRNKKRPVEVLVALDIRLATAFFYIVIVNSLFTVYVVCIAIFPVQAIPYLNVLVYDLDLSKCTIYVLIVTMK
ncbi:unnamed protein product, partial [Mesorhabditis spiculigera]